MKTEVWKRGQPRFDMVGQRLPEYLHRTDECISAGLAKRISEYALARLNEAGFAEAVRSWNISVYTLDSARKPADRSYCVKYENDTGGYIEVIGILTNNGRPLMDHGFYIGQD